MTKIDINLLEEGNTKIEAVDIPEGIRFKISGSIDMQKPNAILSPYFADIHSKVISSKIKIVEVDIVELKFMNSSGIGCLIRWFIKIPLLQDEDKYKIKILYNNSSTWHQKGLSPLKNLAPDLIEIIGREVDKTYKSD